MRVRFGVKTRGLDAGSLAQRARRALLAAAREQARAVAEDARQLAPRDTGELAASVASAASALGGAVTAEAGSDLPQARWTEAGNTPNAVAPGAGPVIAPRRAGALRLASGQGPPRFAAWVRPIRVGSVEQPRRAWPALVARGQAGQLMPWLRVAFRRRLAAIKSALAGAVSAALRR
ncbi:MAG TPA: HK97 gp10 family phage protein [Candidatus Brocadiia bacterium]|nr:HK97 gp10 family phage protein [Candidatus Brocadiia bacterium]